MKYFKIIFVLLCIIIFSFTCYADDITLKDGKVFKNFVIVRDTQDSLYVKGTIGEFAIAKNEIKSITVSQYEPGKPSEIIPIKIEQKKKTSFKLPKELLIPAAIGCGYLSYLYFKKSSDKQNEIDRANEVSASNGTMIDDKNRFQILGMVFGAGAIACTYFYIRAITVSSNGNSLSIRYNF
ncbi:MAG: hypothetical protein ACM3O3_09075 [Syntrophothermus sp.]